VELHKDHVGIDANAIDGSRQSVVVQVKLSQGGQGKQLAVQRSRQLTNTTVQIKGRSFRV